MILDAPNTGPFAGFRESASGLIVPEELSRVREVWTKEERKTIQRAFDLLIARQIRFLIACDHPDCAEPRIDQGRSDQGEPTWTCGHRVRVFRVG